MSQPAPKRATYQDVLDAARDKRAEIIYGVLHVHPRPAKLHAVAASVLGMDIGGAFQRGRGGPGGWVIVDQPELHLGEDILVPDLAGWHRERFPGGAEDEPYFEVVPDWICEVLSPSTAKYDRTDKLQIYARETVNHAWIVDPQAKTLETYQLHEGRWLLTSSHHDSAAVSAPPFEAIELELAALWQA